VADIKDKIALIEVPLTQTVIDTHTKQVQLPQLDSNIRAIKECLEIIDGFSPTADVIADVSVGGISAGDVIESGITLAEFMDKILKKVFYPTFVSPSLSLTADISITCEVGVKDFTLTANFDRGKILGKVVGTAWDASAFQDYRAGVALNFDVAGVDLDLVNALTIATPIVDGKNSFSAMCNYDSGSQPLHSLGNSYLLPLPAGHLVATLTINGVRRFYYGVNLFVIKDLQNSELDAKPNKTFTISIPTGTTSVVFAYPLDVRAVFSVIYIEGLSAEVRSIFQMTTEEIGAINGFSPVTYRVYRYTPAVPFSAQATYKVLI
jgi:hypothetical protein